MSGLVTLGETLGLIVAESAGPPRVGSGFRLAVGGAESNVAIGISRLGGDATWIGRVGSDEVGSQIVRELYAERVGMRLVTDPDAQTGLMLKTRPVPGSSRVRYYRQGSAGSRLSRSDILAAEEEIVAADILHVTGITPALSASAADAVLAALAIAQSNGIAISFDVNHRSALWRTEPAPAIYRAIASQASIVFAGADEAALIVGDGTPETLAERIADLGPTEVIVKLGAAGSYALIDGQQHRQSAFSVPVVDSVGAGDAFVAGYLSERMASSAPAKRLRTASLAGAFACLGPTDWEGYPRQADLDLLVATEPVAR
ncbi:sugar kinase [Microbacterium sp. E-13]|uniref:sugar kinase n=1 Tax=Microbacterium sp. E-13 TaxID=3404048 RepID=UPI003CEEC9E2